MRAEVRIPVANASTVTDGGHAWREELVVSCGTEADTMAGETALGVVAKGEAFVRLGQFRGTEQSSMTTGLRAVRPSDARAFATAILAACDAVEAAVAAKPRVVPLFQPEPKRAARGRR